MRKIEKEEERIAYDQPDKKVYHLCIVNLVIGYVTLLFFHVVICGTLPVCVSHRFSTGPAEYFPKQLTSHYGRQ